MIEDDCIGVDPYQMSGVRTNSWLKRVAACCHPIAPLILHCITRFITSITSWAAVTSSAPHVMVAGVAIVGVIEAGVSAAAIGTTRRAYLAAE